MAVSKKHSTAGSKQKMNRLKSTLNNAINAADALLIIQIYREVKQSLEGDHMSRPQKACLRTLQRRIMNVRMVIVSKLNELKADLDDRGRQLHQLFATRPLSHSKVVVINRHLNTADYCLKHLEAAGSSFLTLVLDGSIEPTVFLNEQRSLLSSYKKELQHEIAKMPTPEESKQKKDQQIVANRERRRSENRHRSGRHPEGKGRRGKRHLPNHPFSH